MTDWIENLAADHEAAVYPIEGFLVWGDAVLAVLPGETTVITTAVPASQGDLSLVLVWLAAWIGAMVGDSTVYWLARAGGPWVRGKLTKMVKEKNVERAIDLSRQKYCSVWHSLRRDIEMGVDYSIH